MNVFLLVSVLFAVQTASAAPHATETPRAPGRPAPAPVPASFRIKDYAPPVPSQGHTGKCLWFAATGIAEWMMGRTQCSVGKAGGPNDFSEKYFYQAAGYARSYFTDVGLDHKQTGYVKDAELPFNGKVENNPAGLKPRRDLPELDRKVLFSTHNYNDRYDPWNPGGQMTDAEIEKIKRSLVQYQSPVLFTYVPTQIVNGRPELIFKPYWENGVKKSKNYWHSNYIVGWNDKGFIVRDSAFGDAAGAGRRQYTLIPYALFKASGRSAAVYHLKNDKGCAGDNARGGEKAVEDYKAFDPAAYPQPAADEKRGYDEKGRPSEYQPVR